MPPADLGCGMPPADLGCGTPPAGPGCGTPPTGPGCGTPPAGPGCGMPPVDPGVCGAHAQRAKSGLRWMIWRILGAGPARGDKSPGRCAIWRDPHAENRCKRAWMCRDVQGCAGTCRDVPGRAGTCRDVPVCAVTCRSAQCPVAIPAGRLPAPDPSLSRCTWRPTRASGSGSDARSTDRCRSSSRRRRAYGRRAPGSSRRRSRRR
jgi:hypothetical protein